MSILLIATCFLFLFAVAGLVAAATESTGPAESQDNDDPDAAGHAELQWLFDDSAPPIAWQPPDLPWTEELDSYSPVLDESDFHVGAFSCHDWGDGTGSGW
ncbi:hypothetical protein [Pseudoxanthomonas indica]|uniref:Secreted protein n=1 Tax=Pseudoxanthomonas indica TaxID=428993 RepID=A0A1T5JHA6_9GAMM|nr:hypothetical protein [Pseudoxanthomonas indica]GGD58649.1 hypothetical protein GCM10007235_33700 [Pseudoxanthomonas indica]SKC50573.1 hypothetical protein SAMN06296058_0790 [Pseudoxanthomonas indica]